MTYVPEMVDVPGASLWTVHHGHGFPLVLCHGGPGDWDYLGAVAEMIDDLVTVYRYDQRACGRSTGEPPYTVAKAIADLEALRIHWKIPQWIVAGHSWGAELARAYSLAYPERAKALIYMAAAGVITTDPSAWQVEYQANRQTLLSPTEWQRIADLKALRERVQGTEIV